MKRALAIIVAVFATLEIYGAVEEVLVVKIMSDDDKGIVQRRNGERWLIEKGVGALSFWRYEGKKALIYSPGTFCGVGSKLILTDVDQEARIWNAEYLDSNGAIALRSATNAPLPREITLALIHLGYVGAEDAYRQTTNVDSALKRFQRESKISPTGKVTAETRLAFAQAVQTKMTNSAFKTNLFVALLMSTEAATSPQGRDTWIDSITNDGGIIKLGDGSIYEVDEIGKIKTMLWLPVQKVVVFSDSILNVSSGQKVAATLIKR